MLRITAAKYEDILKRIVSSSEITSLAREFAADPEYFYSILNDISLGTRSGNYSYIKKYAERMNINPEFIVSIAGFLLSNRKRYERDYYSLLGVGMDATKEEIRDRWISLIKETHPDLVGENGMQRTKELNEAYEILSDDMERARYDSVYFRKRDVEVITAFEQYKDVILTVTIVLLCALLVPLTLLF